MAFTDIQGRTTKPWTYSYRGGSAKQSGPAVDEADTKTLLLIRDSLKAMTGGCGICLNQEGLICTVRWRPVKEDDPRCDSFERRINYEGGEDAAKKVIQDYVNDVLGIRDPRKVKRLTG